MAESVAPDVKESENSRPNIEAKVNSILKSCLYASVSIGDVPVKMLVDTGSSVSLISQELYHGLGTEKPSLKRDVITLSTADGSPMDTLGVVQLEFCIGCFQFVHDVVVAELNGISVILGFDFLETYDIAIEVSQRSLKYAGQTLPLFKESSSSCARIKVSKHFTVPPESQMFIQGYTSGSVDNVEHVIVEPNSSLGNRVYYWQGHLWMVVNRTLYYQLLTSVTNLLS